MTLIRCAAWTLVTILLAGVAFPALAAEEKTIKLGEEESLMLTAPKEWESRKPQSNIVEYEFAIPAAEADEQDGRVTVMGAGGSVEANLDRWIGQFQTDDGKPLAKSQYRQDKTKIAGLEVHLIDLAGTYKDQKGPFTGNVTLRENYRMYGAIIVGGQKHGNYFVKAYGPKNTMDGQQDAFIRMIESLKVK